MRPLLIALIRAYRYLLSPWIGNQCRFHPTCSHYSEEAIQRHGAIKGCGLTIWRLLRCNPWSTGGQDPVPECPRGQNQVTNSPRTVSNTPE